MAIGSPVDEEIRIAGPVGQSVVRADGREKVRGEPVYFGDLRLPKMFYARALRSRYPHARIAGVDASRARALPGVVVVATAADIPGLKTFGRTDQPILSADKVRFLGDVVALVAAETLEIATAALPLIEVQYEPLPAVYEPKEAMQPEAPKVHDARPDNVMRHFKLRKGDVDDAFAHCDVVVEHTYRTPRVEHAYLEVEGAVADCHPDGGLTIWSPGQYAPIIRDFTAGMLGMAADKIRVILTNAGGGFGGKEDTGFECGCRVALLAHLARRPVKLVIDRQESIETSSKRHAALIEYKSGATRDGRLQAIEIRIYLNKGAYASVGVPIPPAGGLTDKTGLHASGPYQVPHARIDVYNVYTNAVVGAAMRGFGVPQLAFAHEAQMDELAAALGMDPLEIRLLNGVEVGARTATNQLLKSSVGLKETMRQATERAGWKRFRAEKAALRGGRFRRGLGMASYWYATTLGPWPEFANCTMEVEASGKILVRSAVAELGQGVRTAHAQMAAQALGIGLEHVVVAARIDTANHQDSQLTVASRGTLMGGNAIIRAAQEAREAMLEMAADWMEVPLQTVELAAGEFQARGAGKKVGATEVLLYCFRCGRRLLGKGWWRTPKTHLDPETAQGEPFHVFAFGTQVAEVEVDTVTGTVEVKRIVNAQDVGRAINPGLVVSQMHGGIHMGLGFALTEEIVVEDGRVRNPSLATYLIPTAMDMPPMENIIVEDPYPNGPFGAKGVGEPCTIPTAAAVANAVADALGVRIRQLPLTAERVWKALHPHGASQTALAEGAGAKG